MYCMDCVLDRILFRLTFAFCSYMLYKYMTLQGELSFKMVSLSVGSTSTEPWWMWGPDNLSFSLSSGLHAPSHLYHGQWSGSTCDLFAGGWVRRAACQKLHCSRPRAGDNLYLHLHHHSPRWPNLISTTPILYTHNKQIKEHEWHQWRYDTRTFWMNV